MIYPGASPEFRILVKDTGERILQVRYVQHTVGYASAWASIPEVAEIRG